jgi:Mrp family chromosome partitioning ATPase
MLSNQRLVRSEDAFGDLAKRPQSALNGEGFAVDSRAGAVSPSATGLRQRLQQSLARNEQQPFQPDPDIVKLFYAVDGARQGDAPYVLQFVAATPGEGTSTIAAGFAATASLEYRLPVLLLDCGPGPGPTLSRALAECGSFEPAIEAVPGVSRLFRARLANSPNPLLHIDGPDLREMLALLKQRYSAVVLDCVAATASSDSLAVSRYCDGTVLVVQAEQARRQTVLWARDALARFGAVVLGTVLNRRETHVPQWLYRHM